MGGTFVLAPPAAPLAWTTLTARSPCLLVEAEEGARGATQVLDGGERAFEVKLRDASTGGFYGGGERFNSVDQDGAVLPMKSHDEVCELS